jgi:small-conductance mechanosensitive channel
MVAWVVGRLLGGGVQRLLHRTGRASRYESFARHLVTTIVTLFGLVLALQVLGLQAAATSLLATGGMAAVVFGFAFREIGENLLAGIFLAVSRSFDVGDIIRSGDIFGTVRSVDLRDVHVRTADGCDIFIPSAQIFRNPLYNYTRDGLRRGDLTVGIDYRDEAEKARRLLHGTVASIPGVLEEPATAVEITGLLPQYVELTVYFWVDTFGDGPPLASVRTRVVEACRVALADGGFHFSSEVTTGIVAEPLEVRLRRDGEG